MRRRLVPLVPLALSMLAGCASAPVDHVSLAEQVRASETAFATSMATRDFAAFASWVADDAVFINGGKPLRGKAAVLAHWERFFKSPTAPFAWKPELIEVLDSGQLAYSEGPVSLPDGRVVARYFSTWRRDPSGAWRIVLDNGVDACTCAGKP
ncbi:MAG: nuclear transport factor 2 family protein [Rubrivivax sp.]